MENLNKLKVAAIQMVSATNVAKNLSTAAELIQSAAQQGAKLVVLPEYFCLMGQNDTDKLKIQEPFVANPLGPLGLNSINIEDVNIDGGNIDGDNIDGGNIDGGNIGGNNIEGRLNHKDLAPLQHFLASQAQQHNIYLIGGTIPIQSPQADRIYNSCLVYGPNGKLQSRYDKIHLFGFDNGTEYFAESDTIMPGDFKPQMFDSPIGKVGLSICYDLRFPELYRAMLGANLIVVPSAFTFTTGRAHWETLLKARAIENQCYVLAAAQGGKHESGRRTWGQSILIDPWGKIVDQLDTGSGVVMGEISMHTLNKVRKSLPALTHRVL